ncbi:MAG: hypothetical protein ACYTBJ_25200, partial [Planctomycetota bacterium]
MDLGQDRMVSEVISRLEGAREGAVKVAGTWGSFAHLLGAHISERLGRPILFVCPHIDDADKAADDLRTFGARRVEPLAAWEGEEDLADATDEIRAERLRLVSRISSVKSLADDGRLIIPTSVQALCQPAPKPEALEKSRLGLGVNETASPEEVVEWLADNNFERVERIDLPGQFARRGGIVDIYAPLVTETILPGRDKAEPSEQGAEAVRVEFFGDTIESLRRIDLDTHRSTEQLQAVSIVSAVCGRVEAERELFLNILPAETIIILEEPNDIEEVAGVFLSRVDDSSRLYSWGDIHAAMQKFAQLHICRFAAAGAGQLLKVDVGSVQQFQHKATSLWTGHKALEELVEQAKRGKTVLLYCESPAEIKRVTEIVQEGQKRIPGKLRMLGGFVHQGFIINSLDTIVVSHHELFGQYALRRRQRAMRVSSPVDTLSDLQ